MAINSEYNAELLQVDRPQPMWDRNITRTVRQFLSGGYDGPVEDDVHKTFIEKFIHWLGQSKKNNLRGLDSFPVREVCSGCTQFIDGVYQAYGSDNVLVMKNDYRYHWRLRPNLVGSTKEDLGLKRNHGKHLILAVPFPQTGDVPEGIDEILSACQENRISVHIDGAWVTCSRDIDFNFDHPVIKSFAISLSKGLGLGFSRVAVRFSRSKNPTDPITIMNDFNMNIRPASWLGLHFIDKIPPDYFWDKYESAYIQVCKDFDLVPTKSIHLARLRDGSPRGVRPLLRYLADK